MRALTYAAAVARPARRRDVLDPGLVREHVWAPVPVRLDEVHVDAVRIPEGGAEGLIVAEPPVKAIPAPTSSLQPGR